MEEAPSVRARSGLIALVALASGCDRLFGINYLDSDAQSSIDAPLHDMDRDGIADLVDNCPDRENPDQHDVDADGVGDVCDDCALDPDDDQADSDGDGVGDVCDLHPAVPRDCLVLLDVFADASQFPTDWGIAAGGRVVFDSEGKPTLTPIQAGTTTIYALGPQAPFLAPLDVEVFGHAQMVENSAAYAVAYIDQSAPGYGGKCGVRRLTGAKSPASAVIESVSDAGSSITPLGDHPPDTNGAMRFVLALDEAPQVTCITTLGGQPTSNTIGMWNPSPPPVGGVGVSAFNFAFSLDGVALYRQRGTSESCPTPIRR